MTVLTHAHGGDLDAIQRTYGIPKEEIIDFSGNINPLGFPKRAEDALKENLHLICTYPDKKYKALKQAIGRMKRKKTLMGVRNHLSSMMPVKRKEETMERSSAFSFSGGVRQISSISTSTRL